MISGLPNARLDELLHFDGGQAGFVQTIDGETLGCVLLDDADGVKAGPW
jgi:F-type H+-transporting ATPase subunit alpha